MANKAQQLAEQNAEVERKNNEIEQARHAVEEKAAELALTSKYKSDFLANMSHELRTPLNSILILAQQLADNRDGNLNSKQVEFAKNVHAAGTDLLNLITDILDLSKIESGTVTVEPEDVSFAKLRDAVERGFRHMAEAKHLAFDIELEPQLPLSLSTDLKRLQQVLKNLLSNAFKFTSRGRVDLRIAVAGAGWSPDHGVLSGASRVIAFEVSDTGIGIQPEKRRIIFEAFHQADAGTSRRYGGTGLGLAISRELATLLGGEIRLTSTPGHGSTFSLYLPENYLGSLAPAAIRQIPESLRPAPLIVQQAPKVEAIADDRESVLPDDPTVLIVEDDPHFARVLLEMVRQKGFKGVVTAQGGHVRSLAREFKPLAIMLDIFLPDMLGWTVLNHLKQEASLRHIPVQIISVAEERRQGLGHGAFSFLIKPATSDELQTAFDRVIEYAQSPHRRLLIVEDNEIERQGVVELLSHDGVEIATAGSGAEAWNALQAGKFDCVVLDLRLPDISGFELMERIRQQSELRELPIIVCTGKALTEEDEIQLVRMAESVVLKNVQSPERLLDETSLFLHLVAAELPLHKQQMLERLRQSDEALRGRKVLVVDDDVRNIFALTSLLERHGVRVVSAETGAEAVARLAWRSGHRCRADGHHDAGDGRLRNHTAYPPESQTPPYAYSRSYGEGDEGRPGKMSGSRRFGLHRQAGQYGRTARPAAHLALWQAKRREKIFMTNEPVANILIVDDDTKNSRRYGSAACRAGTEDCPRGIGNAALRCLLREDFVLILLDVRLPDMGGFETAALIRQRERLRYIPIIFLSAIDTLEDDVYRGVASGAVDYLFKPVVPQVLQAKVSVFIDLFRMNERLKQQAVRQTEERFRLVIESLRDYAVFMIDPQGRINMWNVGAERMEGWTQEEVIGEPFARFYPLEDQAKDQPAHVLRQAALEGRYEEEGWRVRKDGSQFWPTSSLPRSETMKIISSASPRSPAT